MGSHKQNIPFFCEDRGVSLCPLGFDFGVYGDLWECDDFALGRSSGSFSQVPFRFRDDFLDVFFGRSEPYELLSLLEISTKLF